MVKFGRHVDFFVANELDAARQLYVVPYVEVRRRCIEIPGETVEVPGAAALCVPPLAPPAPKPAPAAPPKRTATKASGLGALFGDPANDDDGGGGPAVAIPRAVTPALGGGGAAAGAAVTLNAATGAELAGLVKQMLIHGQQKPAVDLVVPAEYGYDDPCNPPPRGEAAAAMPAAAVDKEAQTDFLARKFQTEWRLCLKKASVDFERAMRLLWSEVFEGVKSYYLNDHSHQSAEEEEKSQDMLRGALPDDALQLYIAVVPLERARDTFSFMKTIHSTALINSEALRKLVKKFDKMHYRGEAFDHMLSAKLLPEVYSSNFTGGLSSVEAGLTLFRARLKMVEEEVGATTTAAVIEGSLKRKSSREEKRLLELGTVDDDLRDVAVLTGGYFGNKVDTEEDTVQRRKEELKWLRGMVASLDPNFIPNLVAHRGFHSIHDRSDVRPLENSLTAYEAAWTNGLHLCECDIALTRDERIILAHDENFARLGMDPTSPLACRTVRDMTFREIMELPLKSGARPPLLFDVLRSAAAIGGNAKMIVEIKAGNTEASAALARLFMRNPQLMDRVAVVMSFDAFIMHSLRKEMATVFEYLYGAQQHSTPMAIPRCNSPGAPINRVVHENSNIGVTAENAMHPLDPLHAPLHSNIALGSCLSTSPHLAPSFVSQNCAPSHNRLPSRLGGHNRLESRDFFGLKIDLTSDNGALGLNLAEIDNTMSQSSTFLPVPKSQPSLQLQQATHEEKVADKETVEADTPMKIYSFPKLLLITVAEPPTAVYELYVDMTEQDSSAANHPDRIDDWLRGGDGGTLDGVYLQYQKAMMGLEGSKAMRNMASRYDVGIWGANPVPDDWDTFHALVSECHVSYVNTSLPRHFRRKMKKSQSANTLAMNGILASHLS